MEIKYHINPKTRRPNQCKKSACEFQDFATKEEALASLAQDSVQSEEELAPGVVEPALESNAVEAVDDNSIAIVVIDTPSAEVELADVPVEGTFVELDDEEPYEEPLEEAATFELMAAVTGAPGTLVAQRKLTVFDRIEARSQAVKRALFGELSSEVTAAQASRESSRIEAATKRASDFANEKLSKLQTAFSKRKAD